MNDLRVSDRLVEFDEGRVSERLHPLATSRVEFDWDALERALGEFNPTERARASEAVAATFRWLVEPFADCTNPSAKLSARRAERRVARTALVIGYLISPETFGGVTVEQLAATLRIPVRTLRKCLADVRQTFGQLRKL